MTTITDETHAEVLADAIDPLIDGLNDALSKVQRVTNDSDDPSLTATADEIVDLAQQIVNIAQDYA